MTTDAAWPLQQAIHQVLAGDATLTALLGGADIFDDVPADRAFPYVTIGQTVARDWGTATEDGREHLVTLHAWSREGGRREANEIIAAIDAALAAGPVAVAGHDLVSLRYEFSEARRDPDGETFHGIVRYRAVTEPVA